MIKVKDLRKSYGVFEALKGITFDASDGEILGLLGPNGAGKTTSMRIMTGFMPASSGEVWIDKYEIHNDPKMVTSMLGYLPESVPLYYEMTVYGFLRFIGNIKGVKGRVLDERLYYAMEATNITPFANEPIRTLSKGYRQRVGIAQAIINDPKYLILDEPTIGLDPNQIIEIRNLIGNLKKNRTIILSTHILSEVEELCDRVIIIDRGVIVASGSPVELRNMLSVEDEIMVSVKSDAARIKELVAELPDIQNVIEQDDRNVRIRLTGKTDIRAQVSKKIIDAGLELEDIRKRDISLEDIFQKLTKEAKEDVA
jgi:ABC-2 type transport system ATP-binding protein